jgi:hypothetical protein
MSLLNIDLLEEKTANDYKELVLEDTDIDNIAITYTTDKKQYPIKQIQINIKTGTSLVKNIYVERIDELNEVTILRKILWNIKGSMDNLWAKVLVRIAKILGNPAVK